MDDKQYSRILIVEVNWLGDVLFSTPFIKAVRKKFKNAHIACMVVPRCAEVLEGNPHIDEVILYDEQGSHKSLMGKYRFVSMLRKKGFDMAILLHRSTTRTLIAILGGIKKCAGYATEKRRRFLTHPVEIPAEPVHKVEHFLGLAGALGCDISEKDYEFFISEKDRGYIDKALSRQGVKKNDLLVILNPGANWIPKRWNPDNYAKVSDALARKYGARVVISGAKKDVEAAKRIRKKSKHAFSLCGKTTLKQLGALFARADFVISGDTGPMHMALAMKTNVIALFGPTSPALTGPYGGASYRVIQKDVGCKIPCYDSTCRKYRCMEAIKPADVVKAFGRMHSEQAKKRSKA